MQFCERMRRVATLAFFRKVWYKGTQYGTHPAFLDINEKGKGKMKHIVALLCAFCLALGASSAIAGGCASGKGGCKPTKLVPTPKPVLAERKCVPVRTSEATTVTYMTPSLSAMYIAGPTCCCSSSAGVYIPAVNGQSLGGTTTLIKNDFVCEGEVK